MIITAILMYLVRAAVIVLIIYAVYRMLSALLEKYQDHASALREQSEALKEIASAIRESNDKNGTPQEII